MCIICAFRFLSTALLGHGFATVGKTWSLAKYVVCCLNTEMTALQCCAWCKCCFGAHHKTQLKEHVVGNSHFVLPQHASHAGNMVRAMLETSFLLSLSARAPHPRLNTCLPQSPTSPPWVPACAQTPGSSRLPMGIFAAQQSAHSCVHSSPMRGAPLIVAGSSSLAFG